MGQRVEARKGSTKRDFRGAARFSSGRQNKAGPREAQEGLLEALLLTVRRYLGDLPSLAKGIEDPRVLDNITYPLESLVLAGVLGFVFRLGSSRDWQRFLRDNPVASERFASLFPRAPGFPHPDTIRKVFRRVEVDQLQEIVTGAVEHLIRGRLLEKDRLLGEYYQLAIDATGMVSSPKHHCSQCLTRTHAGKTVYFHYVLEVKLVTQSGMVLSLMSEFIENPEKEFDKQDCELKAFKRLAKRLKKRFPQLPLVFLLDGLYACGAMFQICHDNDWKYLAVLKEGSIPSLVADFVQLAALNRSEEYFTVTAKDGPGGCPERRQLRWVNGIEYVDSEERHHKVHVLEALVSHPTDPKAKPSTWLWVTNLPITKDRADAIQKGGRNRWKIENEGFNTQKQGGYELEHLHCEDWNGAKNYYLLLQLGHGLHQLLEKGKHLVEVFSKKLPKGRYLASLILEAWRNAPDWSASTLKHLLEKPFQYRWNTA